ncbi:MAG: type II toxin-antitoxin system RelE/ParE family toxin [Hyphomicrobiaceae bacterium]
MSFDLKEWPRAWSDFASEVRGAEGEAKLLTWMEKLAQEGPRLRRNVRPLGDGLFELKIQANRVLYGFHRGAVVVVLCFIKKKQRDQSAVNEARRRLKIVRAGGQEMSDAAIH